MNIEQAIHAYVEAYNSADWERMPGLFTEQASIRGVLGWGALNVALPIWRELHEAMHMRLHIDELIVDGAKGATLLTETGRFDAPFRGLPDKAPTGRSYDIVAIEWFELESGRIARRWAARDSASITRQVLE